MQFVLDAYKPHTTDMRKISNYSRVFEKHSPSIWWLIRALEIITCIAIISNIIHHW